MDGVTGGEPVERRYLAFISYARKDEKWARWLHRALESYRVPRRLVGRRTATGLVPGRLSPIFRDRDDLAAASSLSGSLRETLDQSEFLIVICSPATEPDYHRQPSVGILTKCPSWRSARMTGLGGRSENGGGECRVGKR